MNPLRTKATSAADLLDSYDWDGMADDVEEIMGEFYPQLMGMAYGDAADLVGARREGSTLVFDLNNPRVKDVIGTLARRIRGVADTTRDDVRALVDRATEEGWSIPKLAQEIRATGLTASRSRSETIARTETAHAYSAGSVLAYSDAGITKKKWLAESNAPDAECQIDGEVVGMDENFSNGLPYPPAHPNCRCAISPVVD